MQSHMLYGFSCGEGSSGSSFASISQHFFHGFQIKRPYSIVFLSSLLREARKLSLFVGTYVPSDLEINANVSRWENHKEGHSQSFCVFRSEDAAGNKRKEESFQYDPKTPPPLVLQFVFFDKNKTFGPFSSEVMES